MIFLVQSDTTVGFLSQDSDKLCKIKKRDNNKPFLVAVDSYKSLKNLTRVPKKFRAHALHLFMFMFKCILPSFM